MHLESLREYCLSKKAVQETLPFGPDTLVYKVMGKMFLLTGFENDPLTFNVKCDPEKVTDLREEFSCVQPGYHMNKKHWNTVVVDGSVSDEQLMAWIDHSYDMVVSGLSNKEKQVLQSL